MLTLDSSAEAWYSMIHEIDTGLSEVTTVRVEFTAVEDAPFRPVPFLFVIEADVSSLLYCNVVLFRATVGAFITIFSKFKL